MIAAKNGIFHGVELANVMGNYLMNITKHLNVKS